VIINPASGQNAFILNTLNEVFNPAPFDWQVDITTERGDAARLARAAIEGGADVIAVYGGDGTVVEICNAVAHTDVPVAILPGGTGNALSLSLKIPQQLRQAAELIAQPVPRVEKIDMGVVDGSYFSVGLATGFMAKTVGEASRQSKDQLGLLAYTMSLLQEMQGYPPATYTLTMDDRDPITISAVACNILNVGTFGLGQVSLVPESRATDGYLHVLAFENATLGQLIPTLATAASLDDLPFSLPRWKVKRIRVESTPAHPWMMDGEVVGTTPIDIHIEPCTLPVIVPADSDL
jgi:YegS/Rv2252/BmrU family lipid kinase